MHKLMIQGGVLVLMLLALPLTSLGTTTGLDWANYLGLGAIAVGGLTMPVLRFVGDDEEDENDEEENDDEDRGQEETDRRAREQNEEDDR